MNNPHDNWALYYDFVYEKTYGNFYEKFTEDTIDVITDFFNGKGAILDFGAGTGRIAIPLKQHGFKVTAIEKSEQMANVLKQKVEELRLNIPVYACDIADFDNGKANLALALFTVLSYAIKEERIRRIISNIKKHLEPNGYFFFDLPDINFFRRQSLINIQNHDLKRVVNLIPNRDNDVYTYHEECSGRFRNSDFSYKDEFNIRYWSPDYIHNLLIMQGFIDMNYNLGQFANTGSTYKLYQLNDPKQGL